MTTSLPAPPHVRRAPRRPTYWSARLAGAMLVLAAPVATWWLVGPNPGNEIGSDPTLRPDDYDYLFHPPVIDPTIERVAGVGALVVVAIAATVLISAGRRGRIDRRWLPPIATLTLVGIIAGVAERVMTAAVVGANIGGGFMLLFGIPTVLALIVGSAIWSIQLLRATTPADV